MKLNFEQDVKIDKDNLDSELQNHSDILYHYDEELSDEKQVLANLELELSVLEAETAYKIRNGSYPDFDGKVTEGVVKELIEKDKDVIELRKRVIAQKRIVSRTASAAESMRQRRYMLQKLVDLYIYEYYNSVKENGSRPNMAGGRNVADEQIMGLAESQTKRRRRRVETSNDDYNDE